MILLSLLILLTIIVNITVILLVKMREKRECECSKVSGWKRDFIKIYSIIAIFIIFLIYVFPLGLRLLKLKNVGSTLSNFIKSTPSQLLLSIFIAFGFFNLYFIFKYTKGLENAKCDCETHYEKIMGKALNYYSITLIIIYIITTLITFMIKLK